MSNSDTYVATSCLKIVTGQYRVVWPLRYLLQLLLQVFTVAAVKHEIATCCLNHSVLANVVNGGCVDQ